MITWISFRLNFIKEDSSDEEITFKDEDGKTKVIRPKAFSGN